MAGGLIVALAVVTAGLSGRPEPEPVTLEFVAFTEATVYVVPLPEPTPTLEPTPAPTPTVAYPTPEPFMPIPTPIPTPTQAPRPPAQLPVGPGPPAWLTELLYTHARPGWDNAQINAWAEIVRRESSYQPNAQNPTSTAYGLAQFLDTTWDDVGCVKTSDPGTQIACMAAYIESRYGTPGNALAFHNRNNWY